MLTKIICSLLNRGEISFCAGLNVILGDDDAKNSIGKSSALMIIDFAMGGTSLLEDKAGIIKSMGHHVYIFEFDFNGVKSFLAVQLMNLVLSIFVLMTIKLQVK